MRSFLMKIDERLKISFNDPEDKAAFRRLLSSFKQNGHDKFTFNIDVVQAPKINTKQRQLKKILYSKVADFIGDDIDSVQQSIERNYRIIFKKDVADVNTKEFDHFLDYAIEVCSDLLNIEVWFDDNNHIQIQKK